MKVTGTYAKGKMYRGSGRWAKILETRFAGREGRISIAFGVCEVLLCGLEVCASPAKTSYTYELKPGYRKSLDESARHYVETGEISV